MWFPYPAKVFLFVCVLQWRLNHRRLELTLYSVTRHCFMRIFINTICKCLEKYFRIASLTWNIDSPSQTNESILDAKRWFFRDVCFFLFRFPFMTADELTMVERSPLVDLHPKLFHPQILLAYKFQALPLASRATCKLVLRSSWSHFFLKKVKMNLRIASF